MSARLDALLSILPGWALASLVVIALVTPWAAMALDPEGDDEAVGTVARNASGLVAAAVAIGVVFAVLAALGGDAVVEGLRPGSWPRHPVAGRRVLFLASCAAGVATLRRIPVRGPLSRSLNGLGAWLAIPLLVGLAILAVEHVVRGGS